MFADDERQASIGFTLAREHQGHGYATEAVRALLGELFRGGLFTEIPLHRVTAECGADNLASQRVLERVGMRREAQLVENIFFKGAWASTYNYAILRNEWCR
jgi:aminoglycoside 6'-N-acetyltransferase